MLTFHLSTDNVAVIDRKFVGVANSGKPFTYNGKRMIADLSEIRFKDKTPMLYMHDPNQHNGFGELSVVDNQLHINGSLLENENGKKIADDADKGFPWQLSARITTDYLEEVKQGQSTKINGQDIDGPILVMRKPNVTEVSFTPLGVDTNTSVVVLSETGEQATDLTPFIKSETQFESKQQESSMTPEQIAQLQADLANEKAKNAELEKIKADAETKATELAQQKAELETTVKTAAVEAQLSQAGFKKDSDGKWQGISQGTINVLLSATTDDAKAMIADLTPKSEPQVPDILLSEVFKPGSDTDVQLSQNPLIAAAQLRAKGA